MTRRISEHARHFLSNFRGEAQSNMMQFAEEIWRLESDVCIFMARKAAALFDCLRELGLTDVRGIAVNDRILDTDLEWLRGKSVTLIDDCIFSGTTLYRARRTLIKAGCISCDVLALAVNIDAIRPKLLPGEEEHSDLNIRNPMFTLSDAQCVQQCYDIVRAISAHPRPYDVDFPHTLTAKLDVNELSQLLSLPGWQAFDMSSNFQAERGVKAYTLIPDNCMFNRFQEVNSLTDQSIQVAKIRIYARDMGGSWSIRVVPICMLACLTEDSANNAVDRWLVSNAISASAVGLITASSMYRLLTYVCSYNLFKFFVDSCIKLSPIATLSMRTDLLDMSFGPGFSKSIITALDDTSLLMVPPPTPEPAPPFEEKYDLNPIHSNDSSTLIAALRDPFTWLYRKREIKAREIVRDKGLAAVDSPEYIQLDRLLYGFSPSALVGRVRSDDYNTSHLLSLLIDKYVDLGIAVPTNVCSGGTIYRAFRHGEDAVFGEAQERLAMLSLKTYLETSGRDSIWGLELQKFIVLFVQIALRNSLLDRIDTSETVNVGCRIVSVKGHLHGPVPVIQHLDPSGDLGPPFIEGTGSHPSWLVSNWVGRGFLDETRNSQGKRYSIRNIPDLSIGDRPEANARAIGRTLANSMYLPQELIKIDRNSDLVKLATCAEPDHQARALAAEIQIFRERWPAVRELVRVSVRDHQYKIAHRDLRSVNAVFTSVNSGAMKYRWYEDKEFKGIVEGIGKALLAENKPDTADMWRQLWPESLTRDKSNTPTELQENIDTSGGWLVSSGLCLRLIDLWIIKKAIEMQQCEHNELGSIIDELELWCGYVITYARDKHCDGIRALANDVRANLTKATNEMAARWSQTASALLDQFCNTTAVLLTEEATLLLSTFAKATQPVTSYTYALYLDLPGTVESSIKEALKLIERGVQPIETPHLTLPSNHNPWRRGVWLLLTGNRNSDRLCRVAKRIADELLSKNIAFRMVVIGQLTRVNSIRSKPGSPALAYGTFFRRISEMKDHILAPEYESVISVVSMVTSEGDSEASKFIKLSSLPISTSKIISCSGEGLAQESYDVVQIHPKKPRITANNFSECDIGILTVLPTEASALRNVITFDRKDIKGLKTQRDYDIGQIKIADRSINIVHCQMREAGTVAAASALSDLILEASPHLICVVGIAGSISAQVSFGDVVIGNKIIYYDRRKITDEGVSREACVYKSTPYVTDIQNAYLRQNPTGKEKRTRQGKSYEFKSIVAPIGCGEAVIAMKDSEVRKWLGSTDRKVAAVEMESAGVAHAIWEMGQSRLENLIGVLVVRGISDNADKVKSDDYQFDATANAAFVLKRLLRYYRPNPKVIDK